MKNKFSIAMSLAVILAMLITSLALAAELVTAELTGTANDVTVTQGSSASFTISVSATGNVSCTQTSANPSTATVDTIYSISAGGAISSSTPSGAMNFYTSCSSGNGPITWAGAPTAMTVNASVSVAATTPVGNYTIALSSAAGSTDETNPNTTGGKLEDTTATTITVHVVAPPPPSDFTPPVITPNIVGTLGNNGWYVSDVTVSWTVEDGESAISSSSGCDSTTISADTAGITLTCSATSDGGTNSQSVTIKRDATAPSITVGRTPDANANGWNSTDVNASYTASDAMSGLVSPASGSFLFSSEGAGQSQTFTVTDQAGNSASATVSNVNIDKTAPTASASASPAANGNGWNNTDVTVSFSGTDALSGIDFCDAAVLLSGEGANQSASGTCTDKAGNVSAAATASGINIDKTAPTVALAGGPADGGTYYFGFVPAAPTCSASDALSGIDGNCSVSGYSTSLGSHTVSASATDKAGNSASASATYTVLAWTLKGFYQPVDMTPVDSPTVWNTVKNGSTVPLKFEIFAGQTELTDTSIINQPLKAVGVACGTGTADDIELLSSGNTSLRYDATAGQFIYNWQTPKKPGACYFVTVSTADGSSLSAYFKLK